MTLSNRFLDIARAPGCLLAQATNLQRRSLLRTWLGTVGEQLWIALQKSASIVTAFLTRAVTGYSCQAKCAHLRMQAGIGQSEGLLNGSARPCT